MQTAWCCFICLSVRGRLSARHGRVRQVSCGAVNAAWTTSSRRWARPPIVSWISAARLHVPRRSRHQGRQPSRSTVERSTKFDLVTKPQDRQSLGLTIPPSLLARGGSGDRVNRLPYLLSRSQISRRRLTTIWCQRVGRAGAPGRPRGTRVRYYSKTAGRRRETRRLPSLDYRGGQLLTPAAQAAR
jgi:hypothetical protein